MPQRIVAATVDHGLRSEAAQEASFVSDICRRLGIPHATLKPDQPITGNLQSAAREVRYALLHRHADAQQCSWIATAHHADDQLETFVMRLARGCGVDGLSGIRPVNGRVIRPLLDLSKARLESICGDAGISPMRDPSNDDTDFDRVRIRHWLEQNELPFGSGDVVKSSRALAEASQALDWMTENLADERIEKQDDGLALRAAGLPAEIKRRLLLRAVQKLQPGYMARGEAVTQAILSLGNGGKTMLGDIILTGGDIWRLSPAPPRKKQG